MPFHVPFDCLYMLFEKMSIQVLSSVFFFFQVFQFLIWLLGFFCYWVVWVSYVFWILTPYHIYGLQIFFFPFHKLPFHCVDCFLMWRSVWIKNLRSWILGWWHAKIRLKWLSSFSSFLWELWGDILQGWQHHWADTQNSYVSKWIRKDTWKNWFSSHPYQGIIHISKFSTLLKVQKFGFN